MTKATLAKGLEVLAGCWPDRPVTPGTLNAYWIALQGMDDAVFETAIGKCLTECTFYPKPAEIIAKAEAILTTSGALPSGGDEAWSAVLAAISEYSVDNGWLGLHPEYPHLGRVYGMPCPLPELVQQALHCIGGMNRVCMCPEGDLGFLRREFMDNYDRIREREVRYGGVLMAPAGVPQIGPGGRAA